jgi:hypothetical protein
MPGWDKIRIYRALEAWCRDQAALATTLEERQVLEEVASEHQIEADWLENDLGSDAK